MKDRTEFNYAQRWKNTIIGESRSFPCIWIRVLLFCAGLLIVAFVAFPWVWQHKLDKELKALEQRLADYQDVALARNEVQQLEAQIAAMDLFVKMVEGKAKNPRLVIDKVTKLLPKETKVTSFSLGSDNTVQMNITVSGPVDLARLWTAFNNSGIFETLDLSTVSLVDEVQTLNLALKLKQ